MKIIPGIPLKDTEGNNAWCAFRSVVFVNGLYYLFSEGFIKERWEIYIRTSEDGINLSDKSNPVFLPGMPGSFDEYGQADPTVIYDGHWKMWFDALNGQGVWDKLGYATSDDGFNWVNYGPVISRGEGWDSKSIHHPCCIRHNDKYYLYYSATDEETGNVKNIGLATSHNGINWIKRESPVLTVGDWDHTYIRPSCPILINGIWNMFYWGFGDNHYMGLAQSSDLINWGKKGKVLESDVVHEGITATMPIRIADGIRIYYATFDDIYVRIAKIDE
jgi:predicted GH43/DUF377 family glycosyl hydrolase